MASKQIILTSGTSWTIPSDWSGNNTIECIGAGATATTSAGGGGGAYALYRDLALTEGGDVPYQIGIPSATASVSQTWFAFSGNIAAAGASGATGGAASASKGLTTYSGGNAGTTYGGGGGAAGPHGVGGSGSPSGTAGGAGDIGYGGIGGFNGSNGASGTEWGAAGSGGGGGGNLTGNGGAAGNYGGGGGKATAGHTGGAGVQGVIVITYTPSGSSGVANLSVSATGPLIALHHIAGVASLSGTLSGALRKLLLVTSGTSWTVPNDWSSANTIEGIGGGAGGGSTVGGNGADYAKAVNVALTPGGSVTIALGAAGSGGPGGDTTFGSALLAKGGGSSSTDIGSVTYAGGTGATSGGGGAAGMFGAGGNASGNTGGTADNGRVAAGASGTEWGTAGSGGGGTYVPSTGITIINSAAFSSNSQMTTLAIPSGAQAGDFMFIGAQSFSTATVTPPSGSTTFVTTTFYVSTATKVATGYGYFLTSTDITNGYVPFTTTTTHNVSGCVGIFRGVNASMADVSGTPGATTTTHNPVNITAPGITTLTANDLVLFFAAITTGGGVAGTFTTATGFTKLVEQLGSGNNSQTLQTMQEATPGAIGNAFSTFDNGNSGSYGAFLIALKAA